MKQIIFWLMAMFAIIATTALTACGDDKDEPNATDSSIVGTWYYFEHDSYGGIDETVVFKANGTYEWTRTEFDSENGEIVADESFIETGSYSVSDLFITITCNKISGDDYVGPISDYVEQISKLEYRISGKTLKIDSYHNGHFYEFTRK